MKRRKHGSRRACALKRKTRKRVQQYRDACQNEQDSKCTNRRKSKERCLDIPPGDPERYEARPYTRGDEEKERGPQDGKLSSHHDFPLRSPTCFLNTSLIRSPELS